LVILVHIGEKASNFARVPQTSAARLGMKFLFATSESLASKLFCDHDHFSLDKLSRF